MSDSQETSGIQAVILQGTDSGLVAKLPTYDKKRHTLPEEVNEYTNAFLARLVEDELEELVEVRFDAIRKAMGYKRKDMQVSTQSPSALFEAKDFDFELVYELDEDEPSAYLLRCKLFNVRNALILDVDSFNDAFGTVFDAIVIQFGRALSIETIIDGLEEDENEDWTLDYPSHCSHCEVELAESDAVALFTADALTIQFKAKLTPHEINQQYQKLRTIFSEVEPLAFLG